MLKHLTEADICDQYITPAITNAGWDPTTQISRDKSYKKGRIIVRGKLVTRLQTKRPDYVLYYHHIPIAVVEAKDNNHSVGFGMQQALAYAEDLQAPFVFSSNGDAFLFRDNTGLSIELETTLQLGQFPSPDLLWQKYQVWKGLTDEQAHTVLQPYHDDGSGKEPRYYQRNAINQAIEAIVKGQNRLLLVMATGTGKTYAAFQIIWRLWKANQKKRVLFLADRNILVDQTMVNDFRPFGPAMAKLSTRDNGAIQTTGSSSVRSSDPNISHSVLDTSYEIYLGLYQALTGPQERQKLFRQFSPDFFDLIVIDECHRGSADQDSAWREILEYFSGATQIGLTATPKETEYISNIEYFGEPVYTYSLKQGIGDGFLAPYKVVKVNLDVDVEGYRPVKGEVDELGNEIPDGIYTNKDFDKKLVIKSRTQRVARWISEHMKETGDRFQKTIVFCVDTDHAERMRSALVTENADLVINNSRYTVRMTGNDPVGVSELGNFIDPESQNPVIVTTSRLLSTGVDVQTCRLIVLDREVGSMTEFKQILGRGTRVHEDTQKFYFTLIDFRQSTNHFADPGFDGEPLQIYEPGEDDPVGPPDDVPSTEGTDDPIPTEPGGDEVIIVDVFPPDPDGSSPSKYYVKGTPVTVLTERVEYLDAQGKLTTKSLHEYTRDILRQRFASLDEFLQFWDADERKDAVLDELAEEGLFVEELEKELGNDLDPFDMVCHIAFDQPPQTRKERVSNMKKRDVFAKYGPQARLILEAILRKYEDEGVIGRLADTEILKISPFTEIGTPLQLIDEFGSKSGFESAVRELQAELYQGAIQ